MHISKLYTQTILMFSQQPGFLWAGAWPSENENMFDAHKEESVKGKAWCSFRSLHLDEPAVFSIELWLQLKKLVWRTKDA